MSFGSTASLEFLEEVQNMTDEALYSQFAVAIEFKWYQTRKWLQLHALIYLIYTAIIDFNIIVHQKNIDLAIYH